MAASIINIDLNSAIDTLTGTTLSKFQLTNPENIDTLIPLLEAGRTEEIGAKFYQVDGGNFEPTDSAADGVAYLYVEDTGVGGILAYINNVVPIWSGQGWYKNDAKACFIMKKAGAVFTKKNRICNHNSLSILGVFEVKGKSYFEDDVTISANSETTGNTNVKGTKYYEGIGRYTLDGGANLTYAQCFTLLEPLVPVVGNKCFTNGFFSLASVWSVERTSATVIQIKGYNHTTNFTQGDATSTGTPTLDVSG